MSVVVCKVSKDKIEMASDSIAVKGWTKINNAQNKIVKMMKYNDMIIGGCGNSDEISLLFHYMKTHTIENMDEKGVLDFIIEFRRWKNNLTGNNALNNPYIIAKNAGIAIILFVSILSILSEVVSTLVPSFLTCFFTDFETTFEINLYL